MFANVMAGIIANLRRAAASLRSGGPATGGTAGPARLQPAANVVAASLQTAKPGPLPDRRERLGWLLPTINLVTTALASTALTVASLSYTATTVAELAGLAEVKTTNLRGGSAQAGTGSPSGDLDIAKSVPVVAGSVPETPAEPPSTEPPPSAAATADAELAAGLPEAPLPDPVAPEDALDLDHRSRVVVSAVRLRSGPSNDAEPIGTVAAGVDVEVLAEMDGWIRIATPDRRVGWVYRRFLGTPGAAASPLD